MSTKSRLQRLLLTLTILLFAGTAGGAIAYFIKSMLSSAPAQVKQIVYEVKIIRPPPPPPEVEPPPEVREEVEIPQPEDTPEVADTEPAGEQLGLDAEGTAGGDGFGLVGRKGGRDLLAGSGGAFAWYTGLLKNEILARLQESGRARSEAYDIVVRLWLRSDGGVERVNLAISTGDPELDGAIEAALSGIDRIAQAPPIEMPQPVSLRIVSRI
jgi:protein TonB